MLYTPEEFKQLKETIDSIKTHLPENLTNYIWNNYKLISGEKGPQPCACGSSGKYWALAVDTIRGYVESNIDTYKEW